MIDLTGLAQSRHRVSIKNTSATLAGSELLFAELVQ
jgi:hypothetical protein